MSTQQQLIEKALASIPLTNGDFKVTVGNKDIYIHVEDKDSETPRMCYNLTTSGLQTQQLIPTTCVL